MRRLGLVSLVVTTTSLTFLARAALAQESSAPAAPAAPPSQAPDSPPPRFGSQGQFVVGGGSTIGITATSYDASAASHLSFTFSPNLDYFVRKNVSVGLDIYASYSDNKGYGADSSVVETKTTTVYGGPRVGWNIPFGSAISWWITGTAGVESVQTSQSLPSGGTLSTPGNGAPSTAKDGPYVSLYAPLLVHPVEHFFFGIGPTLWHDFASIQGAGNAGAQTTTVGVGFLVGGYFGGERGVAPAPVPEPAPADPADPLEEWHHPAPARRFGDQGCFLMTNQLMLGTSHSSYAGTPSGVGSGSFLAGFDYFLANHFSLGLNAYASFYNSTATSGDGSTVVSSYTSYGGAMHVGVQIPLGGVLSLYPRAYLGVGGGNDSEASSASADTYSLVEAWISGDLPIVVEPAPHFIVGIGPTISRDVANTATFPSNQQVSNPSTTLGVGLLVGGWL